MERVAAFIAITGNDEHCWVVRSPIDAVIRGEPVKSGELIRIFGGAKFCYKTAGYAEQVKAREIGERTEDHCCAEQIWLLGHRAECQQGTSALSCQSQLLRRGVLAFDQPLGGGNQII